MFKQCKYFIIAVQVFLILLGQTVSFAAYSQDNVKIKHYLFDDSNNILFLDTLTSSTPLEIKKTMLDNPSRLMVDIRNAVLTESKASFTLSNGDQNDLHVTNIKIAQFSTTPEVVRLVFTANSRQELQNINVRTSQNSIIVQFNDVNLDKKQRKDLATVFTEMESDTDSVYPKITLVEDKPVDTSQKTQIYNQNFEKRQEQIKEIINKNASQPIDSLKPLDAKKTVVQAVAAYCPKVELQPSAVKVNDSNLSSTLLFDRKDYGLVVTTIKSTNNYIRISGVGKISIKQPFTLLSPSRIVFDIVNATPENKALLKTINLEDNDIARIGQFDAKTLRIVIESKNPDRYKTIISPDLQSLIITPDDKVNLSDFPNNKSKGQIKTVDVKKIDQQTTLITIVATQPMIHNIKRTADSVKFDLYNVIAPNKSGMDSLAKTDQFLGLNISNIDKYSEGSSWIFSVDKRAKIEHRFNIDGTLIELKVKSQNLPVLDYKPVYAKGGIVIDPGHGGYEPGAMRAGIQEKDINLNVAKKVQKYLQNAGVKVSMTRNSDDTLSLKQRTDFTSEICPNAFVSIHVNSSVSSSVMGLETHWYNPDSRRFAEIMQKSLVSAINSPARGIFNSKFYVINHTIVPSILVEIGFISNDAERYDLLTDKRQEATAAAIAKGILSFLAETKNGK